MSLIANWALGSSAKSVSPDSLDAWPSASHDVDRFGFSPNKAPTRYRFVAVYVSRSEDLEAVAGVLLRILADGGVFAIELGETCKARNGLEVEGELEAVVACAGLASRRWWLRGHDMERVVLYGTLRTSRVPGMVSADRDIYDKSTKNAYEKALGSILVTQESLGGEVMQRVHFSTTVVVFATWAATLSAQPTDRSGAVVAYVGPAVPAEPNERQNRVVVTRGGPVTWVAGSRRFVVRYDGTAVTLSESTVPDGTVRTTSVTSPVTIVDGASGRFGARRYV